MVQASDELVIDVLRFISEHYNQDLRLSSLAERFYVSPTTLSRGISRATGQSFGEYLAGVRSANAMNDVASTDLPMRDVASRNGYSSPSMFSQIFKREHGMTPKEFRRLHGNARVSSPASSRAVRVDASSVRCLRRLRLSYNVDNVLSLGFHELQRQLTDTLSELRPHRLRVSSLYSDQVVRRDSSHRLMVDYDALDSCFDYPAEHGISLIVEMSNRVQWVHKDLHEGLQQASSVFESEDEVRKIQHDTLSHFKDRYGAATLKDWGFELWYDYQVLADGIRRHADTYGKSRLETKRVSSRFPFGGSGLLMSTHRTMFPDFLEAYRKACSKPDFVTFHSYPNPAASHRLDGLGDELSFAIKSMREHGFEDVPLIASEWNLSFSQRNSFNDSAEKGAQILSTLTPVLSRDVEVVYGSISDIGSRYCDDGAALFGGTGILSADGYRKPSFHALSFMGGFPNSVVDIGPNHAIGRDECGNYHIIAFNPTGMSDDYYTTKEYEITGPRLNHLYAPGRRLTLRFALENLESTSYVMRQYMVDDHAGNCGQAIADIAADGYVQAVDAPYVNARSMPDLTISRLAAKRGAAQIEVNLEPHAFCLITLTER